MTRATVALFTALGVACAACSNDAPAHGGPTDAGAADVHAEGRIPPPPPPPVDAKPPPTYAPTFVALFNEILTPVCGSPFCHGSDGYYTLSSVDKAYASLVGVPATSKDCVSKGLLRVAPGKPDESLLYLKVTSPPCGLRMPPQFGPAGYLSSRQIEQMKRWIELGAPFDHVPDSGSEAGPAAPEDATAPDSSMGDAAPRDAAPKDASVESG